MSGVAVRKGRDLINHGNSNLTTDSHSGESQTHSSTHLSPYWRSSRANLRGSESQISGASSQQISVPGSRLSQASLRISHRNGTDNIVTPTNTSEPLYRDIPIAKLEKSKISHGLVKKQHETKNACIVGILVAFCLAVISSVCGIVFISSVNQPIPDYLQNTKVSIGMRTVLVPSSGEYIESHRILGMTTAASILFPILLNIVVTVVFDSLSHVQNTTLRWALFSEERLQYNANPRFFKSAKCHIPNHWVVKIISITALSIAYGAANQMTADCYILGRVDNEGELISPENSGERHGLDFGGFPLLFLGTSVLVEVLISIACLAVKPELVKTWSSNPLMTFLAASESHSKGECEDSPNRKLSCCSFCSSKMTASTENLRAQKVKRFQIPRRYQPSARSYVRAVWYMATALWLPFFFSSIWAITVVLIAIRDGTLDGTAVETAIRRGSSVFENYWDYWGTVTIHHRSQTAPSQLSTDILAVIIQSAAQAVLVLCLHAAEHVLAVFRDERVWRAASTPQGARIDRSLVEQILPRWPRLFFILFKGLAHRMFAFAFRVNTTILMAPIPILVLTGMFLGQATVVEWLSRHEPKGPQPVTYGNINRLAELIDEVDGEKLYWGDKGPVNGGRLAGTSSTPLDSLQSKSYYQGI